MEASHNKGRPQYVSDGPAMHTPPAIPHQNWLRWEACLHRRFVWGGAVVRWLWGGLVVVFGSSLAGVSSKLVTLRAVFA